MRSFDKTANATKLNIKVNYCIKRNNFQEDYSNTFEPITDTEGFEEIYKSIISEFETYKSFNPTVQIKITGKLLGEKFEKNFENIESFRSFLIENSFVSSDKLDYLDKNVEACLVM